MVPMNDGASDGAGGVSGTNRKEGSKIDHIVSHERSHKVLNCSVLGGRN